MSRTIGQGTLALYPLSGVKGLSLTSSVDPVGRCPRQTLDLAIRGSPSHAAHDESE